MSSFQVPAFIWVQENLCTYREISEMFGGSQTTVFECVQRLIDVLCEAGKDVFLWSTPSQIPEIEQEFQQMGGIPGVVVAVLGMRAAP